MNRFAAMQVFAKVVELGSFAGAAEHLDREAQARMRHVANVAPVPGCMSLRWQFQRQLGDFWLPAGARTNPIMKTDSQAQPHSA